LSHIQGLSNIGYKPNRAYKTYLPAELPYVQPNDKLWREIEDAGHKIEAFNGGQMLRIAGKIDLYVKSLKWRYCHTQHKFKVIAGANKKQEILKILAKAPRPKLPYIPQHSLKDEPVIGRGLLRAVRKYKKSI